MKRVLGCVLLFGVLLGWIARPALAVPENDFINELNGRVLPFYYETGLSGSFTGARGTSIYYRKWEHPNERGAIVFLAGRSDPFEIYAETIYELHEAGYSVYAMDHRGQGASGRMLDDPEKGYVQDFDDYRADLSRFVQQVVNQTPHHKRFVVAHSMGGAITADLLTRDHETFDAAALVTPMLKVRTEPYTFFVARLYIRSLLIARKGKTYAPDRGPFDVNEVFEEDNGLTSSRPRWEEMQRVVMQKSEIRLGGPTVKWVQEAMNGGRSIKKRSHKVTTPVLMLTAGDERIVRNEAQLEFCRRAKNCLQAPIYTEGRHMLLLEKDSIRNDVMERILGFFAAF